MLELWLIRHAQTIWNAEHRIQVQGDAPLSSQGLEQAARLARRLQHVSFGRVYSSDSGRAQHTAEVALPDCDVMTDTRLRELSYGTLEGKTHAEFVAGETEAYAAHRSDPYAVPLPGGESWEDLGTRAKAWLDSLPSEGKVAAFSHGGTLRSALFAVTKTQTHEWNVFFGNTSITRLRLGELPTVVSVNDTAHLELGLRDTLEP